MTLQFAMRLHVLFSTLFALAACCLDLERCSGAEDDAIGLLPRVQGIYFWTDDFPEMLKRLEATPNADFEEWEEAWTLRGERENDGRDNAAFRDKAGRKLNDLVSIWGQLRYDKLFDGQVLLLFKTDPLGRGDSQESVALIAHCSAELEEVERLVDSLNSLYFDEASDDDKREPQDREEDQRELLDGEWALESEWFVWTDESVFTNEIIGYLAGHVEAEGTLREERVFQTVFAKLKSDLRSEPTCSVYCTDRALPVLSAMFFGDSMLFGDASASEWQTYFLTELRGFGARLYVNSEEFSESVNAPLALDAFLLMTQPRRGVLQALGRKGGNGVSVDFPTLDMPLSRLMQFELDGDALSEGIVDVMERSMEMSGDESNVEMTREDFAEDEGVRVMRFLTQFGEVSYLTEESNDDFPSESTVVVHTDDPEGFSTVLTELSPESERVTLDEFDGPLGSLDDEGNFAWRESEEALKRRQERAMQTVEDMNQRLARLLEQRDSNPNWQTQKKQLEAQLQSYETYARAVQSRGSEPEYLLFGNWLIAADLNEEYHAPLADGYDRRHSQLKELEEAVESMGKAFGNSRSVCGLISYWSEGMLQADLAMSKRSFNRSGVRIAQPVQQADRETPPEQRQQERLKELAYRQFDKAVLTVANDEDGFRLNGVLIQVAEEEAEED